MIRKSLLQSQLHGSEGRKEKNIMRFTAKSLSRLVATINANDRPLKTMLTLTYPYVFPRDGTIIKNDLAVVIKSLKNKYQDEEMELDYLWFLEFQKRGAPHFHMLTSIDCITPRLRIDTAELWCKRISESEWFSCACANIAWVSDETHYQVMSEQLSKSFKFTLRPETWELLRDENGAAKYATKYACKEYQKEPPKDFKGVGRFWGCSKGVKLGNPPEMKMSEAKLREFLKEQGHAVGEWDILPKYLFAVENVG